MGSHCSSFNFLCFIVFLCFACLNPVSCVPTVASVSDCLFVIAPSIFSTLMYCYASTEMGKVVIELDLHAIRFVSSLQRVLNANTSETPHHHVNSALEIINKNINFF